MGPGGSLTWSGFLEHYPLSLIAGLACASAGFYSFGRSLGRSERINLARILFLTSIWTSFSFSTSWTENDALNTFVARAIYAVAAWVPFAFCRLVLDILPSPSRPFRRFVGGIKFSSVAMSLAVFHPAVIVGVQDVGGIHSILPGPLFPLFVAHLLVGMGLAFLPLAGGPKSLEGIARNKLKYFTLGFFVAYLGAGIHFYSAFSGREPLHHDLLILFFALCVFVGLWDPSRDINELFRRFLAHSLFGLILGLPTSFVVLRMGAGLNAAVLVFFVVTLAPSLFMKCRECLYKWVDRLPLLRDKFVHPDVLAREVTVVEEARTVNEWAQRVVRAAQELFGSRSASVLLRQEDMDAFLIKAGAGLTPGELGLLSLPFDSPVIAYLERTRQCLLADRWEALPPRAQRAELEDLRFLHACAMVPLFWNGQLFGLVCVGPKNSGELFNSSDVVALSDLSRSAQYALAAVMAGQAREQQSAIWAHDLYKSFGPKGGILNLARALRGDFGPLPDAARTALSLAADDAAFVAKNLKKLTDPAQEDQNQWAPSPLTLTYSRSRNRFSPMAKELGLGFSVDVPGKEQRVVCNTELIEYRIIANLMENALRHTPRGGSVHLGFRLEGNHFIGFVRDTGPGIKESELPFLFEPGTQLNLQKKGLAGLGLASVKSVVESHGGKVWVESEVGKGSCFFFSLPKLRETHLDNQPGFSG